MDKREGIESQEKDVKETLDSSDENDDIVEIDSFEEIIYQQEIERMMKKRKSFHRRVIAALMILMMIATYTVFRGSWW